jgi:hypothetical protein
VEAVAGALVDAATWTYENVITPVANGIHVAINFVAGAIKVVWNGIIDTIEDAFRFAETVFGAVKTFFDRLYGFFGWLLTDAKKDILATTQYFDTLLTQGYVQLASYSTQAEGYLHNFFTGLETTVSSEFSAILADIGSFNADQTIDAKPSAAAADSASDTFMELIEDVTSAANWLFDKIIGTASFGSSVSFPDPVWKGAIDLVNNISSAFGQQITDLITSFLNRLQSLASSTQNLGQMVLSTILGEVQDLLLAVLKLLDTIVSDVVKFLGDNLPAIAAGLFGASIGSGFVQAIYGLFFPGSEASLTVQGLGALLLGFVSTVVYKAVFGEVPFPGGTAATLAQGSFAVRAALAGTIQCFLFATVDIVFDIAGGVGWDINGQTFLGLFILFQLAIQLLMIPLENNPTELSWAAWGVGFSGIAIQLLWAAGMFAKIKIGPTIPAVFAKGPRGSPLGSTLLCISGVITLAINIASSAVRGVDPARWISAVLSPLSAIVKPAKVLLKPPYSFVAMGVMDFISDVGGGCGKLVISHSHWPTTMADPKQAAWLYSWQNA